MRWIESYERVPEQAATLPDTRLVYVADREGDIAALMRRAQELGHPADWLIRSQLNRSLRAEAKLWGAVQASEVLGTITFILPGRAGQKAREVRQELRAQRVRLPGHQELTITCLIAEERGAPAGAKPVVWRLVTNREAHDLDAVIELIDWYRARWEIEMFFHVLKNACKVEALQLSHMDRVERALVLYMVVSWRIARLMRLGRTCPELDASLSAKYDAEELDQAFASIAHVDLRAAKFATAPASALVPPLMNERYASQVIGRRAADYDALEVQGVRESGDGSDTGRVCTVDNVCPQFFSVYARLKPQGEERGVSCVGDFGSYMLARAYADELAQQYGWPVHDLVPTPHRK